MVLSDMTEGHKLNHQLYKNHVGGQGKNKVMSSTIDVDGSGSSSKECAEAISFSLKKFRGSIRALSGQTTDSGGGGVLHSSKENFQQKT